MATESLRLPGVFFEAPTPAPEEGLPRMDVAAFVGFAESGPLHLPVVVESPRRFRDVFGADPALAWDDERGELRRAHLGGAVESFFSNGGLRCWVVRVADTDTIVRHVFTLPGLIDANDRNASPVAFVETRARAAGSWCEQLAVSTTLNGEPLPVVIESNGNAEPFTVVNVTAAEPYRYRLDLAISRARVQIGDLLEVSLGPGQPALLLFVQRLLSTRGGVRIEGGLVDLITGDIDGAFWIQPASVGAPAAAEVDPETVPPLAVSEADGLLAAQLALAISPPLLPAVRRLSFNILVWKGTELVSTLNDLGFGSRHPRFWAMLPNDEELFELGDRAGVSDELVGLAREAASPRFALAGPPIGAAAPFYLPWGMGLLRTAATAAGVLDADVATSALERDGLGTFATGLFVDRHLAPVGVGALLGEAEHRAYVATPQQQLAGLHSLLRIEEVSLIALPDAVHRGWTRELPSETLPLSAPELNPIPAADAAGRYPLTWTAVDGADGYTLQRDVDPAFTNPVVVHETNILDDDDQDESDATTKAVTLPAGCPRDVFFRVRAFREGEVGPWSNTRGARLPVEDFSLCEDGRPPNLVLEFTGDSASPGPALSWTTEDPTATLPATWQIEEATDPGFATAIDYAPEGMLVGFAPLPARRFAPRYYRVRGINNDVYGTWSNTVRVSATERATFTEPAARDFDPSVLLAVHRALLRFAAARGDLLAVLSLPDHFRALEAIEHTGRLTPGGPEDEPPAASGIPLSPVVPPLTEGEVPVLSFGAVYHPWIVARSSPGADAALRRLPPDGAITGQMAAMALDEGAWRAPANRPLVGVVALQPDLKIDQWAQLVTAAVNVVLNDARGFLTKSEDTIGGERALNRVHVRRLMILLRRLAAREGQRIAFEPHGVRLRRRVRFLFERLLGELYSRGAFAGRDTAEAFRVVADETVNPPGSVDRGRLIIELRVAPVAALQFLTVRLLTAGTGRLAVEEA